MTEQKCRELIKSDLAQAGADCVNLMSDILKEDFMLNDVDWQLDRIMRNLENAKSRLKNCDDF